MTSDEIAALAPAEFAFPGPVRDRIVAALIGGAKTSSASLAEEYGPERKPFPRVGDRAAVVDSNGARVAVIETTEVRVVRMADVDDPFIQDEGEGYAGMADWRSDHEQYWRSEQFIAGVGEAIPLTDDTRIVCKRFRVIATLD